MGKYLLKVSGANKVEEELSDDKSDNKEIITPYEALTMIDKLINLKDLITNERSSLSSIKERLEIICINNKK